MSARAFPVRSSRLSSALTPLSMWSSVVIPIRRNCHLNGMLVTSASSFGRVVTDVDLTIDRATGDVVRMQANNRIVTRDVTSDTRFTALVDKYQTLVAPLANRVIGSITADHTRDPTPAGESALGDVIGGCAGRPRLTRRLAGRWWRS